MTENQEAPVSQEKKKKFEDGRFEFALFVNDNLVCKRNFNIPNYVEGSMHSEEFKELVDTIVAMIDEDLKSKSRVYTWYHYNPEHPEDEQELIDPVLGPGESNFRFVVYDNRRKVIEKWWDGYGYPKAIRDRVDIANKVVKFITKDGKVYVYDKDKYFAENEGRLSTDAYILKAMIMDKEDLLVKIANCITDECSGVDGKTILDFTQTIEYGDKEYPTNIRSIVRKQYAELGKKYAQKTRDYLDPYHIR